MFPARRFGGGALAVYLDGQPVVDVWTGWSDRAGRVPWTADTAPMVFSATKGMASTVVHRLADRGWHVATLNVSPDDLHLQSDPPTVTVLRSTLMKPEHAAVVDAFADTLASLDLS